METQSWFEILVQPINMRGENVTDMQQLCFTHEKTQTPLENLFFNSECMEGRGVRMGH